MTYVRSSIINHVPIRFFGQFPVTGQQRIIAVGSQSQRGDFDPNALDIHHVMATFRPQGRNVLGNVDGLIPGQDVLGAIDRLLVLDRDQQGPQIAIEAEIHHHAENGPEQDEDFAGGPFGEPGQRVRFQKRGAGQDEEVKVGDDFADFALVAVLVHVKGQQEGEGEKDEKDDDQEPNDVAERFRQIAVIRLDRDRNSAA